MTLEEWKAEVIDMLQTGTGDRQSLIKDVRDVEAVDGARNVWEADVLRHCLDGPI
jgi:hypothetical protein